MTLMTGLRHAERLWVGAGSDHTDREVETYTAKIGSTILFQESMGPRDALGRIVLDPVRRLGDVLDPRMRHHPRARQVQRA